MKSKPSKLFISQSLLCPFKVRTPGARHSNISLPFSFWSGRLFHTASSRGRRRQWHPTLVLLPGKSYGRRSLVGCSPWGREESDTTEQLCFHFSLSCIGEGNGNPLHCSCLENPRDGGAWWAAVYGVAESDTTEATWQQQQQQQQRQSSSHVLLPEMEVGLKPCSEESQLRRCSRTTASRAQIPLEIRDSS